MIKVIGKTFGILELFHSREKMRLKDIAAAMGLERSSVYHILKTLLDLGYLKKSVDDQYMLGDKLLEFTYPDLKRSRIAEIAETHASELSKRIRECVVVAAIYRGSKYIITHSIYNRTLMVNSEAYRWSSVYDQPTGRVLLAFLSQAELDDIVAKHGLPREAWEGIETLDELRAALEKIRTRGVALLLDRGRLVRAMAVPVFGPDERVWASIGSYLPESRYAGRHRTEVVEGLRETSRMMTQALEVLSGEGILG